jgi:dTDP-4-dehydrorhamnose 3,5-epimerase
LSAEKGNQLLIPRGFAHGFLTLTPDCQIVYKCSDYYAPTADAAIRWDDPAIGIDWGVSAEDLTLSDKDKVAPLLSEIDPPFTYEALS